MTPPVRHHAVAVSAEALTHQLARQERSPAGSVIVVDSEIAARRRGGSEWRVEDAIAVSVVARPVALTLTTADVAWAAVSMAIALTLDRHAGGFHPCWWPDGVELDSASGLEAAASAVVSLGPGRIDYAILTARLGPVETIGSRAEVGESLVEHLRSAATRLDEPSDLLAEYRHRCATLERELTVTLLPSGSMRGIAHAIDESFALILRSPTGLRESIPVSQLHTLDALRC
ncbi:MAG: hypothetical protein OEV40_17815 [Acidimicrobiia bacterium]|nr:hypothetical protein [Acidimicrobiia bacterium]